MNAIEEAVLLVIGHLVPIVEACGALVVMLGVVRTVVQQFRRLFPLDPTCVAGMRLQLAESLVIGLDFQVAADVLKTAISPTWNDLLRLAAVIGLRAVLGYLLEREVHKLCRQTEPVQGKGPEAAEPRT